MPTYSKCAKIYSKASSVNTERSASQRTEAGSKAYTPFTSTLDASPFVGLSTQVPVLGKGTVEIPTKRSLDTSGVSLHGSLLLHEVLHAPDVLCNFIGQPLMVTD
jgi:hypothetical protein